MSVIWKFPVRLGESTIAAPRGAKFLTFQLQDGTPCFWALVDESAPLVEYLVTVRGTGHAIPDNRGTYIGTAQDGTYVWHGFVR